MRFCRRRDLCLMKVSVTLAFFFFVIQLVKNMTLNLESVPSKRATTTRAMYNTIDQQPESATIDILDITQLSNNHITQPVDDRVVKIKHLVNEILETHADKDNVHPTPKRATVAHVGDGDVHKARAVIPVHKPSNKDIVQRLVNHDHLSNRSFNVSHRNTSHVHKNVANHFIVAPAVKKHRRPAAKVAAKPDDAEIEDLTKLLYFKLRKERINAFDFNFLVNGENICKGDQAPDLVILCLTKFYDIDTRNAIRETWGSVAKTHQWPGVAENVTGVRLVFLFGTPADYVVKKAIIKDESERFGDIVVADFTDSYYNLTYKVMMGLKWTTEYCSKAKYIAKVDEDMFFHAVNFLKYVNSKPTPENGEVIGFENMIPKVLRSGIWGVPWDVFPFTRFPSYTNGNSYTISGNAVRKIFEGSERMPYLFIEDAFITGVVRLATNTSITNHKGFARWGDASPRLCGFHNTDRIAATNTQDALKREIWRALHYTNVRNCYDIRQIT